MLNIYRASAGSGKTFKLTQDYIHLIFDPKKDKLYRKVLAVTFTNKATEEMKTRILKELHLMSTDQKSDYRVGLMDKFQMSEEAVNHRAKQIMIDILHDYSSFSIHTIDTFFQHVIRAFAREIGVHGGYNLEMDQESILQQGIDNLYSDLSKSENKLLLQWLTEFAEESIEQSENWDVRRKIFSLGKEIFKESYQHKAEETNKKLHDRAFLTQYRSTLRNIKSEFESRMKTTAQSALMIIADHGLTTQSFKGGSRSGMNHLEKFVKGVFEPPKTFFELCSGVENASTKSTDKDVIASIISAYSSGLHDRLMEIEKLLRGDEYIHYNTANLILKHLNTLGILSDLAVQIKRITVDQNSMLISDSNLLLNRIIDESDAPFVYEKTGTYVDHFMIDEFQDTSTLQWRNFYPLMENSLSAGKLNLVVGDVKQSIYRWRNSDWTLLDETITHQFREDQIHQENLDTNWRSDKNIVDFNNSFFYKASRILQDQLNNSLEDVIESHPNLKPLTQKIEQAYSNIHQQISPKALEGCVRFDFIAADENEEGWKMESLKRLPKLLEDVQSRGYKPNDIAILVHKNDEAKQVIERLLTYKTSADANPKYCYNIMGNEGLMIAASSAVRFIVGVMHLLLDTSDSIQRAIVNFEYNKNYKGCGDSEALKQCFGLESADEKTVSPLFNKDVNYKLIQLKHLSLMQMVENIIVIFDIGSWTHQAVFLQAFQDVVYQFSSTKVSDLNSFLRWWKLKNDKLFISTPENENAMRIMTIHKSKGLDFKVVIMPFCERKFEKTNQNLIWCEPNQTPFSDIPLLPLDYSAKLKDSIFAENYFSEQMHQYIDNLNIAYVAFTRAKHELICCAPYPKETKKPKKTDNLSNFSELLLKVFSTPTHGLDHQLVSLTDCYDAKQTMMQLGESTHSQAKHETPSADEKISTYPSVPIVGRLRLQQFSAEMWLKDNLLGDSKLNYGLIMHDILKEMRTKADQALAIQKMVFEGRISMQESSIIEAAFDNFWKLPHTQQWFGDNKKVLNERSILLPSGEQYRPDRVLIDGQQAIVIDYKFGDAQDPKHQKQVSRYKELIAQMGYRASGFLCYVSLGKVVEV
jgi:ATP-dependent exoDNAse (exonuclease V) beta subunit